MAFQYKKYIVGNKYSLNYKIYLSLEGKLSSYVHDVPLHADKENKIYHVINEIPRFETGKFEINLSASGNPIKQDIKKGKLRYYPNLFPMRGSIWNYGALPQTYEDTKKPDPHTNYLGDGDPIDVIEIGSIKKEVGEIYEAKLICAFALIDDNETDWKFFAIDKRDPLFSLVNTKEDIEKHFPQLIETTFYFFRKYKTVTGKPDNKIFDWDGNFIFEDVEQIIEAGHKSWKELDDDSSISESEIPHEDNTVILNEDDNIFAYVKK